MPDDYYDEVMKARDKARKWRRCNTFRTLVNECGMKPTEALELMRLVDSTRKSLELNQ